MVYIITNTFVGSGCLKFLENIGKELTSICHYAFDSTEKLTDYLTSLEKRVADAAARKKSGTSCRLTETSEGGTVVVSKEGMGYSDYIRFSYVIVKGHVHLVRDDQEGVNRAKPEDYIREGGAS